MISFSLIDLSIYFSGGIAMLVMGVGLYEYVKGLAGPRYDPDHTNLNYRITGTGPRKIIMLHGLAGTLNYWKRGLPLADATFTLYMIDLLGFGDSPKTRSEYRLEEHLSTIEKIVMEEQLNDGQTLVLGHSMGALLALALVSRHPEWFAGVILISLPVFRGRQDIRALYAESGTLFEKLSVSRFGKVLCMLHPIYYTEWFRPENIPRDVFYDSKKHTWLSYDRSLEHVVLNGEITEGAKTSLKNKSMLFFHGDRDLTAPCYRARALAAKFSNSRFLTIPNGDHQIYQTHYDAIWQKIKNVFILDYSPRNLAVDNAAHS